MMERASETRYAVMMERFIADRRTALSSLDEAVIRAYARRYGARFPDDDQPLVFWGAVHKARMLCPEMTEEEREISRVWLREHGFRMLGEP